MLWDHSQNHQKTQRTEGCKCIKNPTFTINCGGTPQQPFEFGDNFFLRFWHIWLDSQPTSIPCNLDHTDAPQTSPKGDHTHIFSEFNIKLYASRASYDQADLVSEVDCIDLSVLSESEVEALERPITIEAIDAAITSFNPNKTQG